jgi:type IV pilus assembly protein PilM
MLSTAKKNRTIVGLDVEAGSVAAAEVTANGHAAVTRFGTIALGPGVFREGETTDPEALGEALKELFARNKLSKDVRLGLASQRVAVRTLHLPAIEQRKELETAVRFQAQDQIPMPLDQAVFDWQVVGHSAGPDGQRMMHVVAVAARRESLRGLTTAMRRAGLRPVGIDLSAFGMIRALSNGSYPGVGPGGYVDAPGPGSSAYEERIPEHLGGEGSAAAAAAAPAESVPAESVPARLYCNLGDVTNLAVAKGSACLFTRICPFGVEGIAQKLAERRQLTLEHARQWLVHVGLEAPLEGIDGDPEIVSAARDSLVEGASRLVDELRLSLDYYSALEESVPVDGVVACGPGTTIPGLTERVQRDLGQRFQIGRPQALAHLDGPTAARLTVSFGLGLQE